MLQKASKTYHDMRLRTKLTIVIVRSILLIILANVFMFLNLNRMTSQMKEVYSENIKLNELKDSLSQVQSSMTQYLNTKSTDSLDEYYRAEQTFRDKLLHLETHVTDNQLKLLERDIYYLSQNYLTLTGATIEAKRGRNIEKYMDSYEEAGELYKYIDIYITSLNEDRFRGNTEVYNEFTTAVSFFEGLNLITFVVMAAFDVFLVILVTRNITYPLMELSKAADKVARGELEKVKVVKVHGNDEVGAVTTAFNQMVISIPGYLTRLKESMEKEQQLKEKELLMEAHLKDAYLKYLQAQINPHFLFNTLNAGTQLAMMEHADRTYEYIQNVAAFYRYNIAKADEVTLAEEIRLVDIYIYILNVRFSGEINFEKSIESEDLLDVKLPGMVLQPIVENSINYGIRNMEGKGRIDLSIIRLDDTISISVADNGIGMTEEQIQSILSEDTDESKEENKTMVGDASEVETKGQEKGNTGVLYQKQVKKGNGVGLKNVISRLNLYYNGQNSFEIISEGHDQGTEIVITIPAPRA